MRDDSDGQGKGRSASDAKAPSKAGANPAGNSERRIRKRAPTEVGSALRSVYDDTLKESIPPEMLDLLGKLG